MTNGAEFPQRPQYTPPPADLPAAQFAPPQPHQQAPQYAGMPGAQSVNQQVYASAFARPTAYMPPPAAPSPAPALPALPSPVVKGRTVSIWLFGALGFVLVGLVGYFTSALGIGASFLGFVCALVPLTVVFLGVRLIDRWEPEPKRIVAFAIAWGAIAAVGFTLLVDIALTVLVGMRSDFFSSVIQAPVVEEIMKGLGIFLIFLVARRAFDGPVDGVVYGALVGAGFAFTENIQYFAISLIEGGGEQLTATFFMRAVLSPFAHAMFTALTGFAMGLAARRHATAGAVFGAGLIGLLGAIALHAFWNGSAMFADFFALYVTLQVPLFIGFILAIVALKREEARLTRTRLEDYVNAGWFTPEEVTMLATPGGRKAGLAWAASLRGDRTAVMKSFIKDASDLAAVRQRAITGRDAHAAEDERALLARMRATRAALLAF